MRRLISMVFFSCTLTISSAQAQGVIWQWDGLESYDKFGWDVSILPSLDGDANADVLVGAVFHDPHPTLSNAGQATIYSGATGNMSFHILGPDLSARLGISASDAGFIDGDNVPDFLIGADREDTPNGTDSGRVCAYSGATLSVIRCHDGEGRVQGFGGARAVTSIDDIDQDGRDDYIVTAPLHTDFSPFRQVGKVYIYSGGSGQLLATFLGEHDDDFLGAATTDIDDISGDGVPDF